MAAQGNMGQSLSVNRLRSDVVSQSQEERPLVDTSATPSTVLSQQDPARTRRLLVLLRARIDDDPTGQVQEIQNCVRGSVRVDAGAWPDTALCVAIRRGWPDDVVNVLLNDPGNRTSNERFLRFLCQLERSIILRQQGQTVVIDWDEFRVELENILRKGVDGLEELSLMDDFCLRDVLDSLSEFESPNKKLIQAAILDCGYGVRRFSDLRLHQLYALLHPSVLLSSSCPWRLCLELSRQCSERAFIEKSSYKDWLKLCDELETLAGKSVELHEDAMDDDEIGIALESKSRRRFRDIVVVSTVDYDKKKFATTPAVDETLKYLWYHSEEPSALHKISNLASGLGKLLFQFLICLVDIALLPLLLPIGFICLLPCAEVEWLLKGVRFFVEKIAADRVAALSPFVVFTWYSLSYLAFFAVIIAVSVSGVSSSFIGVLEWVILVYWLSLTLEEYITILRTPLKIYAKMWSNWYNFTVVLLFLLYFVLRLVGVYAASLQSSRAASHIFGFAGFVACLSLMDNVTLYLVNSVGLVTTSIRRVLPKVVNFLALLVMFLVAFGVCVTGVQRGSVFIAHNHPARVVSGESASNNGSDSVSISFQSSALHLFWALFGQTNHDSFDVDTEVESVLSRIIFAFWLVMTSLILLNMLIGLVSDEYSSTKDDAVTEWNFLFAQTIGNVVIPRGLMVFPLPFNIFYRFNTLLVAIISRAAGIQAVKFSRKECDREVTAAVRGVQHKELYPRLLEFRSILLFVYYFRQNGEDELVDYGRTHVYRLAENLNAGLSVLIEDVKHVWTYAVALVEDKWQLDEEKATSILRARRSKLSSEAVHMILGAEEAEKASIRGIEDLARRMEMSQSDKFNELRKELSEELSALTKLVSRLVEEGR